MYVDVEDFKIQPLLSKRKINERVRIHYIRNRNAMFSDSDKVELCMVMLLLNEVKNKNISLKQFERYKSCITEHDIQSVMHQLASTQYRPFIIHIGLKTIEKVYSTTYLWRHVVKQPFEDQLFQTLFQMHMLYESCFDELYEHHFSSFLIMTNSLKQQNNNYFTFSALIMSDKDKWKKATEYALKRKNECFMFEPDTFKDVYESKPSVYEEKFSVYYYMYTCSTILELVDFGTANNIRLALPCDGDDPIWDLYIDKYDIQYAFFKYALQLLQSTSASFISTVLYEKGSQLWNISPLLYVMLVNHSDYNSQNHYTNNVLTFEPQYMWLVHMKQIKTIHAAKLVFEIMKFNVQRTLPILIKMCNYWHSNIVAMLKYMNSDESFNTTHWGYAKKIIERRFYRHNYKSIITEIIHKYPQYICVFSLLNVYIHSFVY